MLGLGGRHLLFTWERDWARHSAELDSSQDQRWWEHPVGLHIFVSSSGHTLRKLHWKCKYIQTWMNVIIFYRYTACLRGPTVNSTNFKWGETLTGHTPSNSQPYGFYAPLCMQVGLFSRSRWAAICHTVSLCWPRHPSTLTMQIYLNREMTEQNCILQSSPSVLDKCSYSVCTNLFFPNSFWTGFLFCCKHFVPKSLSYNAFLFWYLSLHHSKQNAWDGFIDLKVLAITTQKLFFMVTKRTLKYLLISPFEHTHTHTHIQQLSLQTRVVTHIWFASDANCNRRIGAASIMTHIWGYIWMAVSERGGKHKADFPGTSWTSLFTAHLHTCWHLTWPLTPPGLGFLGIVTQYETRGEAIS